MKKQSAISRTTIVNFLDRELKTGSIEDFSSNGLQVEGIQKVSKIGLCVDASLEAYQAAVKAKCQMLVAHHGMIWGGLKYLTGADYRQVKFLVENNLNLYVSHLPLDLHPRLGNNAQIAKLLGVREPRPFGSYHGTDIGFEGRLPVGLSVDALSARLAKALGGRNVILPFGKTMIRRVAIVSGSAGELMNEAVTKGIDCYVTGESKHDHHHRAKEAGISVIYCGHYHSEKPGVMALGNLIAKRFDVPCEFLDIPTIV